MQDLANGHLDVKALGEAANGDENTIVTTRTGNTYPSAERAINIMFQNGGLPATPFTTKALMTASALVDGDYAMVTDDTDNNGLYVKTEGAWVKSEYDFKKIAKDEVGYFINEFYGPTTEYVGAIADENGNVVLGVTQEGVIETSLFNTKNLMTANSEVAGLYTPSHLLAYADAAGNVVLGIKADGSVTIPRYDTGSIKNGISDSPYVAALGDSLGNVVAAIEQDGSIYIPKLKAGEIDGAVSNEVSGSQTTSFDLINCDSILFVGDSYTASHYTLKDKSFVSVIGNLTDYRVINWGVSGNDALNMNDRIIEATRYFTNTDIRTVTAKYAFIATFTNDGVFRAASLSYYKENLSRLVESVKSLGITPILFSEFPADAAAIGVMREIAKEQRVSFVDGSKLNFELGGLKRGIFHQGHPGTRTNAVFTYPMLDAINELPRPNKSIKIFRKRAGVVVSDKKDLLTKDMIDRCKKFKEISVSHYRLADTHVGYYDELDGDNVYTFSTTTDEYMASRATPITVTDYALVEIVLDGTAKTLDEVTINLTTDGTVYIRDYLDKATNVKRTADPTEDAYQNNYANARGAWKPLTSGKLKGAELNGVMLGDKIQLLVVTSGAGTISNISVDYQGVGGKVLEHRVDRAILKGDGSLLANSTFDTMTSWETVGSPSLFTPIDSYNSPRKSNDRSAPVAQVITVDNVNKIKQSVTVPKLGTDYKLTVWCRYFPKAYLDNAHYNLDPNQVIQRGVDGSSLTGSMITTETSDIRTLQVAYKFSSTAGVVVAKDFTGLYWRGVEMIIHVPDAPNGAAGLELTFSCTDGEIQIAKINLEELL